jgi:DNA repair exonuclease SbcCD ATPase subunit
LAEPTKKEIEKQLEEANKKIKTLESNDSNSENLQKQLEEANKQVEQAKKEAEEAKAENAKIRTETNQYIDPEKVDLNDGQLVTLTFAPQYSAKRRITLILKKREEQIFNGKTIVTTAPSVEGLPERWTIRFNQRVKVTKNQFRELYKQGWIARTQDTESQKELFESIEGTFPEEFKITGKSINEGITSPQVIQQIYNDKLRVVG